MQSKTKVLRAEKSLKIMEDYIGMPKTLQTWLEIINNGLTNQNSIKSTKELAHMFRYIKCTMGIRLVKKKQLTFMSNSKMCNTYYILNNIKGVNVIDTEC